ncbi:MAG: M23 family metallopeptidase [Verrucomicrobia bacterium]|nr:M23 family metallopeptidase [Verrucomicrobiota bacterium]
MLTRATRYSLLFLLLTALLAGLTDASDSGRGATVGSSRPVKAHVGATKSAIKMKSAATKKRSSNRKAGSKSKRRSKGAGAPVTVNPSRPPVLPPPALSEGVEEDPVLPATPAFPDMDLPTDNQMLFSQRGVETFFQPTFSGRTISAMFGCVRNPGKRGQFTRFHEGVDIRPLMWDAKGEPQDDVRAAGEGTVAYICRDASGSNYGKYVVVEHRLFGPPFYTLYGHLSRVEDEIETGSMVGKSQKLGVLGRTSNEFNIEQERAHLHFEVVLMVTDRYVEWSRKTTGAPPRHGLFNGANLIGLDPVRFFQFLQINPDLGIGQFVTRERVAFRAIVPARRPFFWIRGYPFLMTQPPSDDTCAYEIWLTYYGLPVRIVPKTRVEISDTVWKALGKGIYPLTYAGATELSGHPCCSLVEKRNGRWRLSVKGRDWLNQALY